MTNLTAEYDVATELGLGLVNCVVAAIHENTDEAYPRLPHSLSLYVDDAYRGAADPVPPAQRTGIRTRAEIQASTPTMSLPQDGVAELLWSRSRTAVRTAVSTGAASTGVIGPIGPGPRPTCWPRITVSVRLRAWLRDTPQALPEFLDGVLHLTAGVVRTDVPEVGTFLGLDLVSEVTVAFEPAPGTALSDEQRALAEQILRNYLRADAEPATFKLNLPSEVRRFDYKLEPGGPLPSAMLMVTLSDRPPGVHGTDSVTGRFLPTGADFAVAVGREYLLGVTQPDGSLAGGILPPAVLANVELAYTGGGPGYSYHINPDLDHVGFDLQPGSIVVSVSGAGAVHYGWWFASGTDNFTFTTRVRVRLVVDPADERALKPELDGDPEVTLSDVNWFVGWFEGMIKDAARNQIKNDVNDSLDSLSEDVKNDLKVGGQLEKLLATLHPSPPGVVLTGVEIRPDGVVAAGTVALAPSRPVEVRRTVDGRGDALESWIPGGTIERFEWDGDVEEHKFLPSPKVGPGQIARLDCLMVRGTRVTRGGGGVAVSAEDCPVVVAVLPPFPGLPTPPVPCHRPLLPLLSSAPDGGMEIVGHYDPWASGRRPSGGPTNLLVHFAEGSWAQAAEALEQALARAKKRDAALVVVGVLGPGGLAQAPNAGLNADVVLLLTDDPAANWASVFSIGKAPASALVSPEGKLRWTDEGPLDAAKLSKVLDKQLEPGGAVSWQPLRPTVAVSNPAPDAPLGLHEGRQLAVRRLRGASLVLSFWTSCSQSSIEQLRQLGEALASGRGRPLILGVGDGESAQQVAHVAEQQRLPFPLVPDPEREIARRYGISSWPTTIQIDPDGRVVAADLGLVPGLSPCDRPTMVGVY